jgi:hypothetical protein
MRDGRLAGDVIALAAERLDGRPLLVPAMRAGATALQEPLDRLRARSAAEPAGLPETLQRLDGEPEPYRVEYSPRLQALDPEATGKAASAGAQ